MGGLVSVNVPSDRIRNNGNLKKFDALSEFEDAAETTNPEMRRQLDSTQRPIHMILYGPGEGGKTTLAHKLMLINGHNLSDQRKKWRPIICYNVIEGANIVLTSGCRVNKVRLTDEKDMECARIIQQTYMNASVANFHLNDAQNVIDAILYLVDSSELFKKLLERRGTFSLFDTWMYFVEKIREYPAWGGKDWDPTAEDVLKARNRTVGASFFSFSLGNQRYTLGDLGGQKNERKHKLVFALQMDCLLFVTSLSEYCEALFEDSDMNRLKESLRIWTETVKHNDFKDKMIILFLNKVDLFKRKYYDEHVPIVRKFKYGIAPPKYNQEEDEKCEKALTWFKDLYMNQIPDSKKNDVQVFVTCAFNTESVKQSMGEGLTALKTFYANV